MYQPSYGQGKLTELRDAPGEYYQLTTPVTAAELMDIAIEMANDRLKPGEALTSPSDTQRLLTTLLRDMEREVFAALFLDNQHQLIKFEVLFYGTVEAASVYPREVVKRAQSSQWQQYSQSSRPTHHAAPARRLSPD